MPIDLDPAELIIAHETEYHDPRKSILLTPNLNLLLLNIFIYKELVTALLLKKRVAQYYPKR